MELNYIEKHLILDALLSTKESLLTEMEWVKLQLPIDRLRIYELEIQFNTYNELIKKFNESIMSDSNNAIHDSELSSRI